MNIDKEFKNLIPPLTAEEKQDLEESCLRDGIRDSLIVWSENDTLLDGHSRYEIAERHNLAFQKKEVYCKDRNEAKLWIIKNQFARRNLTPDQRAILATRYKDTISEVMKSARSQAANGKRWGSLSGALTDKDLTKEPLDSRLAAAKAFGVSERDVRKASQLERKNPEAANAVLRGELTLREATKKERSESNEREPGVKVFAPAECKAIAQPLIDTFIKSLDALGLKLVSVQIRKK